MQNKQIFWKLSLINLKMMMMTSKMFTQIWQIKSKKRTSIFEVLF
ncbi:hypothetical protein HMPREF0819_0115 [Streptococcus equinus ATCC 9812]|uniref:Uncharacterized protein n=1 Tax=Streptococcus equinus ATCC 9812 TaxID=525379 RepID=E8JM92_STREI|nr:hypothetical protein HMPREF0819_0115 [Streptococcus equinus ATCC 9812]